MFAKLGDYLNQHNIQRPMRYAVPSGEKFVILPAKDYILLTGIDVETLPSVEIFDTVPSAKDEESGGGQPDDNVSASALAHLKLEEEISVESLPL